MVFGLQGLLQNKNRGLDPDQVGHPVYFCMVLISVVDPNSFFSDSDPQIIFFGYGFGFLD
jgi:hypothetical protein